MMKMRHIQRTMVITLGALAEETAAQLAARLDGAAEPQEAVVILPGEGLTAEAIRSGIEQISRINMQEALARRGWRLDRLDELAVVVLADFQQAISAGVLAAAAEQVAEAADSLLGIGATSLLVALLPEPSAEQARRVLAEVAERPLFERGVVVLSRVNTLGLRLAAVSDLAATAAHLLYLLLVSALRDAAEWTGNGRRPVLTMGAAVWEWSPEEVEQALGMRWARTVLDSWLQGLDAEDERDTAAPPAHSWLEGQGVGLERLATEVQSALGTLHPPHWSLPQPWQMGEALGQLLALSAALGQPQTVAQTLLAEEMEAFWQERWLAAREAACALLAEAAPGGPARLLAWLEALQSAVSELVEAAATRHEREDTLAAEFTERHQALEERISDLLAGWPTTAADWLHAGLRPWSWPPLFWCYQELHRCGQELAGLITRRAELEREQVTTAVLVSGYERWLASLAALERQADELRSLLLAVRGELAGREIIPVEEAPLTALYRRLVESEALEAERAAEAIGGLDRLLLEPVAGLEGALLAAGQARMAAVRRLAAVELLQLQLLVPEAWAWWWQQLWEAAAPLWLCELAQQPEGWTAEATETTVVLAADGSQLRQLLGLPESAVAHWLAAESPEHVVVVRLRSGLCF